MVQIEEEQVIQLEDSIINYIVFQILAIYFLVFIRLIVFNFIMINPYVLGMKRFIMCETILPSPDSPFIISVIMNFLILFSPILCDQFSVFENGKNYFFLHNKWYPYLRRIRLTKKHILAQTFSLLVLRFLVILETRISPIVLL